MRRKILFGIYEDSIEPYMDALQNFDNNNYEVHIFDNVDNETLKNLDLKLVLDNSLEGSYNLSDINIISNIEEFIVNLFKEHSFEYNSFIYDNTLAKGESCSKFGEKAYVNCNFNLYAVNDWNTDLMYTKADEKNLYEICEEKINNYISSAEEMSISMNNIVTYYDNVNKKSNLIKKYVNNACEKERNNIENIIKNKITTKDDLFKIYINSFLFYTFKKKEYSDYIINEALNSSKLDKNNRFFIMYQLIAKGFPDSSLSANIHSSKVDSIYDKVFDEFKEKTTGLTFIPKKKRNKDLIFVFISQILGLNHGPTKTVLDRCYSLIKYLKKTVILINTRELVTDKGIMALDDITFGNFIYEYNNLEKFKYKDICIPFYQPNCQMPDENECQDIVNLVRKYKPYMIYNIGGYSITADLCAQIVPMATISTSGNYSISKNKGTFFIMGRKPEQLDYDIIAKEGHPKESIIESKFTFDLKKQTHNYTRMDFGIPEDKFVLTFIGGRLQNEADEKFIKVLDKLAKKGCFIISIGGYDVSEELIKKYPIFYENFKDLGYQDDILACIDLVDLYLNPVRQGGGTSAVECMFKEKPALSLKVGDVSMLLDESMLVDNYDEMIEVTLKCKEDKEFYDVMSKKAKEKATDLMDTKKYFTEAHNKIINSPIFK